MLESFIENVESRFSISQIDLRENVKAEFYENVPRCCIVENQNLVNKVLYSNNVTSESILQLCSKLKVSRNTKKSLQKLSVLSSPDIKELKENILLLQKRYEDRIIVEEDKISYITKPIVLNGAELGRFKVCFTLELLRCTILGRLGSVYIYALDPNEKRGYFHPHIEYDALCVGDAQGALFAAVISLDIIAYFEIVEAVLNTYNPGSPYIRIEEWIGYTCSDCGEAGLEEYTARTKCNNCENILCEECSLLCEQCDEYRCAGCYSQGKDLEELCCCECKRNQCLACWEDEGCVCDLCGQYMCWDCAPFVCEDCDRAFCSNCNDSIECENCEETFCAECHKKHTCEKEEE